MTELLPSCSYLAGPRAAAPRCARWSQCCHSAGPRSSWLSSQAAAGTSSRWHPRHNQQWRQERLKRCGVPAAADTRAEPATTLAVPADFSIVSADGRWRVRPVSRDSLEELKRVVAIQAQGFYEGSPVPFMDGMFKNFFTAEVLSELQKKVRFNPAERFVMLVAEPAESGSGGGGSGGEIVGVVEVSYLNEKEVLQSLGPGTQAFAYIASMSVDAGWQRQGVASALLRAAETVAELWEEERPLLHVYQDNLPAIRLYEGNGYRVIFQDGGWWARLGARPRYLMQKQLLGQLGQPAG